MATEVLNSGEEPVLQSSVKRYSFNGEEVAGSGVLFLTSSARIVFAVGEGIIRKVYSLHHDYSSALISNVRVEKLWFGDTLAIDVIYFESGLSTHRYDSVSNAADWVEKIGLLIEQKKATDRIALILNLKQTTTLSEISAILQKYPMLPQSIIHIDGIMDALLRDGIIKGYLDKEKNQFTNTAFKQEPEAIRRNTVERFDIKPNGTIELKCPFCGSFQELNLKAGAATCNYCGRGYLIPDKILSLL